MAIVGCANCNHEPSWHRVSSDSGPHYCILEGCQCSDYKIPESESEGLIDDDIDLDDLTPYTGPPFDARVSVVIRTHTTNGRGWCGTCKRMVIPADHLVEQLQIHFTIREKPRPEQVAAFEADLKADKIHILGEYLVIDVGECTCDPYMGQHQRNCGVEPIGKLIDIL